MIEVDVRAEDIKVSAMDIHDEDRNIIGVQCSGCRYVYAERETNTYSWDHEQHSVEDCLATIAARLDVR